MSTIEWTDETWNPTVGCWRVSPGCDGCYAMGVAHRAMQPAHEGLTVYGENGVDWNGTVRCLPDRLDVPLRWRKPRRVFVDSMSDLFHPDVPSEFISKVFQTMGAAEWHTFQVLTKRPQRMAKWVRENYLGGEPKTPNIWLGTSVETQRYADLRIPHLLATPAAVRFLSIEPLLGPVDITDYIEPDWIGGPGGGSGAPHPLIDWVIVGGESGPGARPMHPQWVRDLRDQCVAAGVPFFFKQWGEYAYATIEDDEQFFGGRAFDHPTGGRTAAALRERSTAAFQSGAWRLMRAGDANGIGVMVDDDTIACKVGKKVAGRELDGRTWDEYPS